jgi:hypothetical protein
MNQITRVKDKNKANFTGIILFLSLFLLSISFVSATQYYVNSTSGLSTNNGTDVLHTWSFQKYISAGLSSGDIVSMACGEEYRGGFILGSNKSNTAINQYGNCNGTNNFRIYGSVKANTSYWTDKGSNRWKSGVLVDKPLVIYINQSTNLTIRNWSSTTFPTFQDDYTWNSTDSTIYVYSDSNPSTGTEIEIPTYHRAAASNTFIMVGAGSDTIFNLTIQFLDLYDYQEQIYYYADNSTWNDSNFKYTYGKTFDFEGANYLVFAKNNFTDTGNKMRISKGQGEGVYSGSSTGMKILNNTFIRNGGAVINFVSNVNAKVEWNRIINCTTPDGYTSSGMYPEASNGTLIYQNYVENCRQGIEDNVENVAGHTTSTGNNWSYNTLVNVYTCWSVNSQIASGDKNGSRNLVIDHNTCYRAKTGYTCPSNCGYFSKAGYMDYADSITFKNNLIVDANATTTDNFIDYKNSRIRNPTFNNNSYYSVAGRYYWSLDNLGTATSFNNYKTLFTNQEKGSLATNPLLNTSTFCPMVGSPLIGAATDGTNIGACQNSATETYTPPSIDDFSINNTAVVTGEAIQLSWVVSATALNQSKLYTNASGTWVLNNTKNYSGVASSSVTYNITLSNAVGSNICFNLTVNDSSGGRVNSQKQCTTIRGTTINPDIQFVSPTTPNNSMIIGNTLIMNITSNAGITQRIEGYVWDSYFSLYDNSCICLTSPCYCEVTLPYGTYYYNATIFGTNGMINNSQMRVADFDCVQSGQQVFSFSSASCDSTKVNVTIDGVSMDFKANTKFIINISDDISTKTVSGNLNSNTTLSDNSLFTLLYTGNELRIY